MLRKRCVAGLVAAQRPAHCHAAYQRYFGIHRRVPYCIRAVGGCVAEFGCDIRHQDFNIDTHPNTDADSDANPGSNSDSDADSDPSTRAGADSDANSDTDTDTDSNTNAGTDSDSNYGTDASAFSVDAACTWN